MTSPSIGILGGGQLGRHRAHRRGPPARAPRPEEYLARQPFDQVPAFSDGDLQLFETGAILLYLAEKTGQLVPRASSSSGGCFPFTAL